MYLIRVYQHPGGPLFYFIQFIHFINLSLEISFSYFFLYLLPHMRSLLTNDLVSALCAENRAFSCFT